MSERPWVCERKKTNDKRTFSFIRLSPLRLLATSLTPPFPSAPFHAPALISTNASNHGLTPQLTTACKDLHGVSSPPKKLSRWSCVENGTVGRGALFDECEYRDVYWVVWSEMVHMCW